MSVIARSRIPVRESVSSYSRPQSSSSARKESSSWLGGGSSEAWSTSSREANRLAPVVCDSPSSKSDLPAAGSVTRREFASTDPFAGSSSPSSAASFVRPSSATAMSSRRNRPKDSGIFFEEATREEGGGGGGAHKEQVPPSPRSPPGFISASRTAALRSGPSTHSGHQSGKKNTSNSGGVKGALQGSATGSEGEEKARSSRGVLRSVNNIITTNEPQFLQSVTPSTTTSATATITTTATTNDKRPTALGDTTGAGYEGRQRSTTGATSRRQESDIFHLSELPPGPSRSHSSSSSAASYAASSSARRSTSDIFNLRDDVGTAEAVVVSSPRRAGGGPPSASPFYVDANLRMESRAENRVKTLSSENRVKTLSSENRDLVAARSPHSSSAHLVAAAASDGAAIRRNHMKSNIFN